MKVFFRTIHLYLSLAAGIVIFCSCLTGTMLVFEKEIEHTLHAKRYYVQPQQRRLPVSQLTENALKQVAKAKIASVMVYTDVTRTVEVGMIVPERKDKKQEAGKHVKEKPTGASAKKGKKDKDVARPNLTVFVNPYTGQVTGQYNHRESFLYSVEMLHRFLLAGKDSAGDMVVAICTLFFLFILITGVVLWWPKTKTVMRQRLKIKWGGSTKRLVHDLHIVTGFYTSVFLIVIVLTGLIMTFNWANQALFAITGSKLVKEQPEQPKSNYTAGTEKLSIDAGVQNIPAIKTADYYTVRLPRDSSATYGVIVLPQGAIETTADTYYIDQYNGKVVGEQTFASKSLGQRVKAMVKPVHTGSVYGLPTKIISFVVCLLSLIFPVTGVMMWLNRTRKKKKPAKKLAVV
ncbi:PepSY-associated TM helix domain-containing protein [Mucilaginibacter flavus]|uniref:PepSY-associated TM helix domain-containing protein n=1 Tax=Mucilaginibacter flavus TaxID=931504 RepID=UPI0025B2825C|nr:PepSY-associated TM helix domain-containing protein [Mucilaginibacter flavus]MDN3584355.1 PepSY-associated TM helix domain-containing protein [Mucilaginibacter flavus]